MLYNHLILNIVINDTYKSNKKLHAYYSMSLTHAFVVSNKFNQ